MAGANQCTAKYSILTAISTLLRKTMKHNCQNCYFLCKSGRFISSDIPDVSFIHSWNIEERSNLRFEKESGQLVIAKCYKQVWVGIEDIPMDKVILQSRRRKCYFLPYNSIGGINSFEEAEQLEIRLRENRISLNTRFIAVSAIVISGLSFLVNLLK